LIPVRHIGLILHRLDSKANKLAWIRYKPEWNWILADLSILADFGIPVVDIVSGFPACSILLMFLVEVFPVES
jgi:hypothetical protein